MWYSPYMGSRNSSMRLCIESGDGRTKHRHRRCRIFSRFALSNRLASGVSGIRAHGGVDVLGKVDFVAKQRGLCRRGRDYGDLLSVGMLLRKAFRRDRPTVSLSSKRIFIFAAEVPAVALSPADTILVM